MGTHNSGKTGCDTSQDSVQHVWWKSLFITHWTCIGRPWRQGEEDRPVRDPQDPRNSSMMSLLLFLKLHLTLPVFLWQTLLLVQHLGLPQWLIPNIFIRIIIFHPQYFYYEKSVGLSAKFRLGPLEGAGLQVLPWMWRIDVLINEEKAAKCLM